MAGKWPLLLALLCVALVWPLATGLAAEPIEVRDTGKFVVDTAGVLNDAQRAHLEKLLKRLEEQTTDQVKVLTLSTTGDEDIFAFSQHTFEQWKVGQAKKDNGALIVLAIKDRKVRVHTGYGLEGALPDQWIGTLSRQVAGEYFRGGRYAEGLSQLTEEVINKVAADRGVMIDELPPARLMPQPIELPAWLLCCIVLVIVAVMIYLMWRSRHPQRRVRSRGDSGWGWDSIPVFPPSRGGSSWSSGGGFGGGFGGGGGSFGGGGHSGGGGGGASW